MANPRKFSEKIALHNQKQAEETARFEQIMREVSDATNKVNSLAKQHLRINPALGSFRGGSLPNVNHVASNTVENKTDLPNTLSNLEELNKSGRTDAQVVYRDRGRSVGVGPMRGRPIEKRIDTSPYGGAYLSPPDTNWRRTNSDSALHQSTQDVGQRRQHHDSQILGINFNDKTSEQRPRSCYEDSLVPGINIHPSHNEPGAVQIPIGNNTGSLPDLTSFHFPSPLPTPLDQEDPSSSFSTSPQGTSSCTLSPSLSIRSREGVRSLGRFPFSTSSPQESRVPSPHSNVHSQVQNQPIRSPLQPQGFYPQQRIQNLTVGPNSPGGPHSPNQNSSLQNHLSVPTIITSSYLHQSKGVTQDHSATVGVDNYSQPKLVYQNPPLSPILVTCSLSPSSDLSPQQQSPQQQQINTLNTYRNPQPNRPSPQSSPGLSVQQYRSASPGENHNSAPPSPASPAGSPGANTFPDSNYFISHAQQAAALQQHFEQFNMDWCQLVYSLVESGSSWSAHLQMDSPGSITYIASPNSSMTTQAMSPEEGVNQDLGTDTRYYSTSPSQLQYNRTGGSSTQQTTPQTPNTPSSIPDIILTDFSSNTTDDLTKPSLGSAISDSFDSDLFPSNETLRAGLGPIDFDGFQMLTDPDMNVISDPTTEDHFRLDRNHFETEDFHFEEIENYPNIYKRKSSDSFPGIRNIREGGGDDRRQFVDYELMKTPSASCSQNSHRSPFSRDTIEGEEGRSDRGKRTSYGSMEEPFRKALNEGDEVDSNAFEEAIRKRGRVRGGEIRKRGASPNVKSFPGSGKFRRYLDYSNSQMPFNEGKSHHSKQQNKPKSSEQTNVVQHTSDLNSRAAKSKEDDVEIPEDGSVSEYSRVRRFLDHERVRNVIRSTLEAKEASMSEVLDPNLNWDGILEPHVRKRRGHEIKRDLWSMMGKRKKAKERNRKKLIN